MDEYAQKIADLNDAFRKSSQGGLTVITPGIRALSSEERTQIVAKVRLFNIFNEANDPHRQHDFGVVERSGQESAYWKIDHYDEHLQGGSEDPADPAKTTRVLTIMLASEY